jgi:hypothetical protein
VIQGVLRHQRIRRQDLTLSLPGEGKSAQLQGALSLRPIHPLHHQFAAGIDAYDNSTSSSWLYPLYDVHGNVKATLTRSGATGYSTANWKSYDVWGGERASTGSDSMFGYCGNLGHPTDPENGLIYMRFLSEDPAKDGMNWYIYAYNSPTNYWDFDGRHPLSQLFKIMSFFFTEGANGKSFSMLSGDSAFKAIDSAIRVLEKLSQQHLQSAIDKEEEAFLLMLAPAMDNGFTAETKAKMYESLRGQGAKHRAYSAAYKLGSIQLKYLRQILEITDGP